MAAKVLYLPVKSRRQQLGAVELDDFWEGLSFALGLGCVLLAVLVVAVIVLAVLRVLT